MARARVGILGGGQLARMTAEAAVDLDVEVVIVEREAGSPAGQIVGPAREVVGDWRDEAVRRKLIERVDVVTLENEFVDAAALAWFVDRGWPVYPSPGTVGLIQDKLCQKQALAAAGLPVGPFRQVSSHEEILAAGEAFGWPLVLKARRNAYDGYGNATLRTSADLEPAMRRLSGGTGAGAPGGLYVEAWAPFTLELALMVARGCDGDAVAYPVVETVQRDHICHEVVVAARVSPEAADAARRAALAAVSAVDAVGVVGVELFLLPDGRVLVNELAPRPHNSGHYTIEACQTSQFENHLRAVLGWPLGSSALIVGGAAMANLLGTVDGPAAPRGVAEASSVSGAHLHLYGKAQVRPGRKMGHVTALADDPNAALARARQAAACIDW